MSVTKDWRNEPVTEGRLYDRLESIEYDMDDLEDAMAVVQRVVIVLTVTVAVLVAGAIAIIARAL